MEQQGVNSSKQFLVKENAPILEFKGGQMEETGRTLMEGTVVNGLLKTRIIKVGRDKVPFRIIQLTGSKGYISPQVVNLYIGDFANLDGLAPTKDKTPVKDTAYGEKKATTRKKAKNFIINYGIPITGGVVGYKIAKKMGADDKKTLGYILFFTVLGCIPRYLYRNK
jgi:hypothetical protein